jgi:hypothetical protein
MSRRYFETLPEAEAHLANAGYERDPDGDSINTMRWVRASWFAYVRRGRGRFARMWTYDLL